MKIFLSLIIGLSISTSSPGSKYVFSVRDTDLCMNGRVFKVIGLRCSNSLISDKTTLELIDMLDTYKSYGVNTVAVYFMGSRFGDVKGYRPDASLDPDHAKRMGKIIEAADMRGMLVLVGCLYWGTSRANEDLGHWTQTEANLAVANTVRWLVENEYRNTFVDPDNEGMAVRAKGWSIESMIAAAHEIDPSIMIANNTKQKAGNSDLNVHFGPREEEKPWLDTEATPKEAPGGYWGDFSKTSHRADSTYYNYSRIGRYTAEMRNEQIENTAHEIQQFNGYVMASTWLQCGSLENINGPFTRPGGRSSLGSGSREGDQWNRDIDTIHPDAGILWWLEFVKEAYGPWKPAVNE